MGISMIPAIGEKNHPFPFFFHTSRSSVAATESSLMQEVNRSSTCRFVWFSSGKCRYQNDICRWYLQIWYQMISSELLISVDIYIYIFFNVHNTWVFFKEKRQLNIHWIFQKKHDQHELMTSISKGFDIAQEICNTKGPNKSCNLKMWTKFIRIERPTWHSDPGFESIFQYWYHQISRIQRVEKPFQVREKSRLLFIKRKGNSWFSENSGSTLISEWYFCFPFTVSRFSRRLLQQHKHNPNSQARPGGGFPNENPPCFPMRSAVWFQEKFFAQQ